MIKNKGNIQKALKFFQKNKNKNFFSFLYDDDKKKFSKKGLLQNAVCTVKDLFSTQDAPTQASSKILKNFNSFYDATLITKIKEAGGYIIAKTHLDELGLGGTGQYSAFGLITNPLDNTRVVGGSSSGSVATFDENIAVSFGSDTGDSIRLPASFNNLYGFKPSYGAISRYGLFPYSSSLDTIGYFAHNLHDIILTSNAVYGKDEKDMTTKKIEKPIYKKNKPQTIAFIKNQNFLSDYQKEAYQKLRNAFINDGIVIKDFSIPEEILISIQTIYEIVTFLEACSNNFNLNGINFGNSIQGINWEDTMIKTRSKFFGQMPKSRFLLAYSYLNSDNNIWLQAQKVKRIIVDAFNEIKDQVDVLVYPSSKIAPKINEKTNDLNFSYLIHANFSGSPSLTIPFGWHQKMPFGLSIDGKIYEDKKLLSHALYIEDLLKQGFRNE